MINKYVVRGFLGGHPNYSITDWSYSMKYLYRALDNPTRLYIKQCPHCGLKYFGKTVVEHIEQYQGSGIRWTRHLKKHNVIPVHLWNSDWYYDTAISRFALKFSHINKIVESQNWANLADENGLNGGNLLLYKTDDEIKQINNKRINTNIEKYGVPYINQTQERREYYKQIFTNRIISEPTKEKMSVAKKGKGLNEENNNYGNSWTDEQKQAQSKQMKGRYIGENNPMYGKKRADTTERNRLPKRWVTNGLENKLILREKTDDYLGQGYRIGRSKL